MSYITGKSRLSRYLEETEEDSKMREKNLIDEFGDGEDYNELIDEVMKNYGSPFKNSLRKAWFKDSPGKAWWHRPTSLLPRSRADVSPTCITICIAYAACVILPIPFKICDKGDCSCEIPNP